MECLLFLPYFIRRIFKRLEFQNSGDPGDSGDRAIFDPISVNFLQDFANNGTQDRASSRAASQSATGASSGGRGRGSGRSGKPVHALLIGGTILHFLGVIWLGSNRPIISFTGEIVVLWPNGLEKKEKIFGLPSRKAIAFVDSENF